MRRAFATALVLAMSGCYQTPASDGISGDKIVTIQVPESDTIQADGATIIDLALVVAPGTALSTPISVEVSSGALSASADPTSTDARKLTLKNLGTGTLPFKMRVGNVPGNVLLTANVGGYLATQVIHLAASPVKTLSLEASRLSLPADGQTGVDLTARLFADTGSHQVSLGARIRFDVCCLDAAGYGVACGLADPLVVPSIGQLASGQAISVRGVTNRILSGTDVSPSIPIILVAQLDDANAPSLHCATPDPEVPRAELTLVLQPVTP
jgi:hypothetical protein